MTKLPEFVIDGAYEDHDWREAAANTGKRTKAQERLVVAGPARHPYSSQAYRDEGEAADGVVRWFPSREDRDRWYNVNAAGRTAPPPEPGAFEGGTEQVKADRKAAEVVKGAKQSRGTGM
jgi:hypothetical protein